MSENHRSVEPTQSIVNIMRWEMREGERVLLGEQINS